MIMTSELAMFEAYAVLLTNNISQAKDFFVDDPMYYKW